MLKAISAAALCLVLASHGANAAKKGLCKFDTASLSFSGTAQEQATCLLRFVKPKATGSDVQTIPPVIAEHAGQPSNVDIAKLKACLASKNIAEDDVGGPLSHDGEVTLRRYFVIHDTSSPEIEGPANFPADINEASYSGNRIGTGWTSMVDRVNVLVNRVGQSRLKTDFGGHRSKPAVKLEMTSQVPSSRKVFVHIENIQPRIKPPGSWAHKAPDPGFSTAQLERLALLYVVASARAKTWLIPAFHFNIDSDLFPGVDVHDDPQAFDLGSWDQAIGKLLQECQL